MGYEAPVNILADLSNNIYWGYKIIQPDLYHFYTFCISLIIAYAIWYVLESIVRWGIEHGK